MMSCHIIPTWHEWNENADDIMMVRFAFDRILDFIPLFIVFKTFKQYSKMASAWESEGLVSEALKQIKMPQ